MFEEQIERRKLELLLRARQRTANQQGRPIAGADQRRQALTRRQRWYEWSMRVTLISPLCSGRQR